MSIRLDLQACFPLVFTDMDGTLLDHHDYSTAAAEPLLNWLIQKAVPVIPVTSKTRPEVIALRQQLGLIHPFVVENGAAIFIPQDMLNQQIIELFQLQQVGDYWVKAFAPPRAQWLRWLEHVAEQLPDAFTCFSWLQDAGVARETGLALKQAALANERDYSEPILWLGSDLEKARFVRLAEQQGYHVIEGGRFMHVTSGYDKGQALQWLVRLYAKLQSLELVSLALGDSGNDIDMLEAADHAIVIRSPVKDFPEGIQANQIQYSQQYGPAGWLECLAPFFGFTKTQSSPH